MSSYRRQILEVTNRHVVISLMLDRGLNTFCPVYDGGVDLPSSAITTARSARCH
ncbi:hypothetical protein [Sphingomonas sp. BK069]|uniref:hypothetical protein n=1 Tax=Sphingomonas sp. BK069 TaxID=2586979 RepID=UPI0016141286|nr:hypothetical protein [Sphingomonas sp. BK069]MBB3348829.1 hypothetical protein [Sphingomonas sp. BK069]